MSTLPNVSPELLKKYQEEIESSHASSTSRRKLSSLRRFFDWASAHGHFGHSSGVVVVSAPANFAPPIRDIEDFAKEADAAEAKASFKPEVKKVDYWWE